MKFSEVLDVLMEGKPITRTSWEDKYIYYDKDDDVFVYHYSDDCELIDWTLGLEPRDLIADDWDIDYWGSEDNKEE